MRKKFGWLFIRISSFYEERVDTAESMIFVKQKRKTRGKFLLGRSATRAKHGT